MTWLALALSLLSCAGFIAERARRRRLQAEHERALASAVQMTTDAYSNVIDRLTIEFSCRLLQMESEVLLARRLDLVELYDSGLFVHGDGQVSRLPGEIGAC